MLIPLQCDIDRVMEPLPESYLEYLLSGPLNSVPPPDNPQHTVVLLLLPLLASG
jgi:hypothetical protein